MQDNIVLSQIVNQYLPLVKSAYQKAIVVSVPRNTQIDYTGFNMLNINLIVTESFESLSPNIGKKTRAILNERIQNASSLPIVVDYFEILFSPEFQLDLIDFFIGRSKLQPIIIVWRYNVSERRLIFAAPNHSDFYIEEITTQIPFIEGDTHEI